METTKMINDIYNYAKEKYGDKKAREVIVTTIRYAVGECTDGDIGKAIYDAIKEDHDTYVKKKKVA